LLGQQDRIVPGKHDDRSAEAQSARARTEPGQEVERGRDLPIAREVVLDHEGAAKAEPLRLDVVVDEVTESLAAVELRAAAARRGATEQAEFHRLSPLSRVHGMLRPSSGPTARSLPARLSYRCLREAHRMDLPGPPATAVRYCRHG